MHAGEKLLPFPTTMLLAIYPRSIIMIKISLNINIKAFECSIYSMARLFFIVLIVL